jgi:hypothetical protein
MRFTPRLDILPPAQRRLWDELGATPPEFTLYERTAIALQLGHRQSVDFDFFTTEDFDADDLRRRTPYLSKGETIQRAENTLTIRVERGDFVLLSFFKRPFVRPFAPPLVASDNQLKVAALIDLAGLKADLVQQRARSKDFLDLDALFRAGIPLIEAMAAARLIHGPEYRPEITLKALSYFGDGDLPMLAEPVRKRLLKSVAGVDLHEFSDAVAALKSRHKDGAS